MTMKVKTSTGWEDWAAAGPSPGTHDLEPMDLSSGSAGSGAAITNVGDGIWEHVALSWSGNSLAYAFSRMGNITTIPEIDTSGVTNMSYMFSYCTSLVTVPALNMSAVTSTSSANILGTSTKPNLTSFLAYGSRYGFSLNTAPALDAAALNTVFTNLGTPVGAQTITITGCAGAATCDRSIATNKGWTVSG